MVYSSIVDAAQVLLRLGKGALLAKVDVASAYRIIPVHPEDRMLLGMSWEDKVYVDKQLPFGFDQIGQESALKTSKIKTISKLHERFTIG